MSRGGAGARDFLVLVGARGRRSATAVGRGGDPSIGRARGAIIGASVCDREHLILFPIPNRGGARQRFDLNRGAASADVSFAAEARLQQRPRTLGVAIDDRVSAHIGERLGWSGRIEAAHGREGRAADHEQVRDVPALSIPVDDRGPRIVAHARAALVVGSGCPIGADRGAPHQRGAHGAPDLLHFGLHVRDTRKFVRPPSIVSQARRRQTPAVANVRIEIDGLVGVGQVFGLGDHRGLPRVIPRKEIAIASASVRDSRRRRGSPVRKCRR
jgi:hypothetical protein